MELNLELNLELDKILRIYIYKIFFLKKSSVPPVPSLFPLKEAKSSVPLPFHFRSTVPVQFHLKKLIMI